MVRPKKQSKRITCHHRYKVIKKVNEHHRKVRKEEKKKAKSKFKPRDPGIPNSYPLKEELLKQLKEKKAQEEEAKAKAKLQRVKQQAKKRKLADLHKDAERRAKEFEKRQAGTADKEISGASKIEHSRKSFYKEFKKVVDAADVVIQVLDARDPLGCRCPQIEEMVTSATGNKRLVLLLNKVDLIPKKVAESWLKYLREEFPTVAFKASTQAQRDKLSQSKVSITEASKDLLQTSTCLGAAALLKLLGNYAGRSQSDSSKAVITVGIVGFPNVGKSSVINSLKRSKSCHVGSVPGITKAMQEVQLDKHVKLLDSPGIVMATGSTDTQIILRNAVKVEQLQDTTAPVEAILKRCNKQQVMQKYCIADYKDSKEFLTLLAMRLGRLKKGGVPDCLAAAKILLQDWNSGKMSFYTQPPERSQEGVEGARVVEYFGAGFNLQDIATEEKDDLNGLLDSLESALVIDPGKPTQMEAENEDATESDEVEEDSEESEDEDASADMSADEEQLEMIAPKKKVRFDAPTTKKETINDKSTEEKKDTNNLQLNKQTKKTLKKQQKQKRKQITQMLEKDENAMKDDDEYNFQDAL